MLSALQGFAGEIFSVVLAVLVSVGLVAPAATETASEMRAHPAAVQTAWGDVVWSNDEMVTVESELAATSSAPTESIDKEVEEVTETSPPPQEEEEVTLSEAALPTVTPTAQNSFDEASQKAHATLVNIICASEYSTIGGSTGSGVIIDPKGIIVTNAHVAQYFLIEAEVANTDCIIRTGNPARDAYEAKLIFISPQWMGRHALTFSQIWSAVNGDYDYAFLAITKSLTDEPLPSSFPYVSLGREQVAIGEEVLMAGYAAELLDEDQIDTALSPTLARGSVKSVEAFSGTLPDVLRMNGNVAAQGGSSGGAILNAEGVLEGVITLASRQKNLDERDFVAISTDYIRRSYEKEEGKSLDSLLAMDTRSATSAFERRIPDLAKPLLHNLNNPNRYYFIEE